MGQDESKAVERDEKVDLQHILLAYQALGSDAFK